LPPNKQEAFHSWAPLTLPVPAYGGRPSRVAKLVMPIPAASDGEGAASAFVALFHQVHDQLREEINGLDADALNWVPVAGANSIATIITHLVGSEAETLLCVAGLPCERDRGAEFAGRELTMGEVLELLDGADSLITAVKPQLGPDGLTTVIALPTLPAEEVRSGLIKILGNYGHAREHVGEIQLTKQLYEEKMGHRQPPPDGHR
jgi:hypothetical protein